MCICKPKENIAIHWPLGFKENDPAMTVGAQAGRRVV